MTHDQSLIQMNDGLTRRLLALAEAEAVSRECNASWLETFTSAARQIYARLGYAAFGELPDFPLGRTRVFLMKSLH